MIMIIMIMIIITITTCPVMNSHRPILDDTRAGGWLLPLLRPPLESDQHSTRPNRSY
jgi:hypothetical protein